MTAPRPHGSPSAGSGRRLQGLRAAVRSGGRRAARQVAIMFSARGIGFRRLAESHAGSVAGDTLVAMALAGSLFFSVPSAEARANVALYLLLTLAPFAIIGPFLGGLYERHPAAYRSGLTLSSGLRSLIALVMVLGVGGLWLFPLAFLLLVLSRFHGISKSSVLPVVLDRPSELIVANAHLAKIGLLASAVAAPVGGLVIWLLGPWAALLLAAGAYVGSAISAVQLPALLDEVPEFGATRVDVDPRESPRPVRLARFATAGVRFLNGFLLLLVAFALRDADAGIFDFSTVLGAAGFGYFAAAFFTPILDRHMSEEPMVVVALAVEAAAAFIAAQFFGLAAAAALAWFAGFAWGTAKFGFDGLLQATLPAKRRGREFTNAETLFQVAWVLGALIPVIPLIPIRFGLVAAGLFALAVQVVYVTAVLVPVAHARRRSSAERRSQDQDVLDLLA